MTDLLGLAAIIVIVPTYALLFAVIWPGLRLPEEEGKRVLYESRCSASVGWWSWIGWPACRVSIYDDMVIIRANLLFWFGYCRVIAYKDIKEAKYVTRFTWKPLYIRFQHGSIEESIELGLRNPPAAAVFINRHRRGLRDN